MEVVEEHLPLCQHLAAAVLVQLRLLLTLLLKMHGDGVMENQQPDIIELKMAEKSIHVYLDWCGRESRARLRGLEWCSRGGGGGGQRRQGGD